MRASRGPPRIQASKQASKQARIRKREDVALSTLALKGEGIIKKGFEYKLQQWKWISLKFHSFRKTEYDKNFWKKYQIFFSDYKSKQSQEDTTAVQYTLKHTIWGNSDWLTFSQAKIWLDGKWTREINSKNPNERTVTLLRGCESSSERRSVSFRDIQTVISGFNMRVFTLLLKN